MAQSKIVTGNEMHAINRSVILDFVRRKGPTSRVEIARELDFSLPTVMRIVDELEGEGLVNLTGQKEFSGGRRRPLLEINAAGNAIIGIDLGGPRIYGAATDLGGNVLVEKFIDNQPVSSAEESYRRLARLLETLTSAGELAGRRLLGVGIGAQGVTSYREGVVLWDPIQKWKDYPLRQVLMDDFDLPVVVDNDVNLAALGELWFGVGQNTRNMVLITIGTGIGAGIIVDGLLYRSANFLAGEIGYLLPGREFLGQHSKDEGVLESKASLAALMNRARQAKREGGVEAADSSPEMIFKAMIAEQPWTRDLMEEMIDYLSIAVANVSSLLDPDVIILRSGFDFFTEMLVEPILKRINGLTPIPPHLAASKLEYKATALGAIVEVLHDTTQFYHIRRL